MVIKKRKSLLQAAFEKRFEIDHSTGCWEWIGQIFEKRGGYGAFTHRPSGIINARAHRIAWQLYKREILPSSVVLLHRCDNPLCVNPAHLIKGTQADNIADMKRKGRVAVGERHSQAKLTEDEVALILGDNRKQAEIAADYGVSIVTISDIKRRKTWQHVQAARL